MTSSTHFELNLQKLSLDALLAEQERSKLRKSDIEREIESRKSESVTTLVTKFLDDAAALGLSSKQALQLVRERVVVAPSGELVADSRVAPEASSRSKPSSTQTATRRAGPRVGVTYAHPTDATKRWTKTTTLGAPARWLTALVQETGKGYADFEVRPTASESTPALENPFPFKN